METKEAARAIKAYLIQLCLNDKLPADLNDLSIDDMDDAIKERLGVEEDED